MIAVRFAVTLLLVGSLIAHADTVLLADNSEVNGVVMFDGTNFIVIGRTKQGQVQRKYERTQVEAVEFNDFDFNGEEPPTSISVLKKDPSDFGTEVMTHDSQQTMAHKSTGEGKSQGTMGQKSSSEEMSEETVAHKHRQQPASVPSASGKGYTESVGPDSVRLRNKGHNINGHLVRIGRDQVELLVGRKRHAYRRRDVVVLVVGRGN